MSKSLLKVKSIKCPLCDKKYVSKKTLYEHMDNIHHEQLEGLSPAHFFFDKRNKNTTHKGHCTICKKETEFNETTEKYERLCKNPKCKEAYVMMFRQRMLAKGKDPLTQLNDPKRQLQMLEHRKISGKYRWSDGKEFTYTGTYEKDLLEYLDKVLNYPSSEVFSPAMQVYKYSFNGKDHFYLPDVYLNDINLLIEVKGSNKHYRDRDLPQEILKEEAVMKDVKENKINYIKVLDKKYDILTEKINELREDS